MNTFKLIKTVGYGAFLWLIVTSLVGAVYGFGLYFDMADSLWTKIVAALIAGGVATIFAKEIGTGTSKQALGYGFLWLIILVLLDLIIIAPLTSEVFNAWQYWFGHLLVFLAPLLVSAFNQRTN